MPSTISPTASTCPRVVVTRALFRRIALAAAAVLLGGGLCVQANAEDRKNARIALRIPSQPLDAALLSLAQQAGVQLAAAGELDRGQRSGEVSGTLTLDAALSRLLAGTGYTHVVSADGVVTVMRAHDRPGVRTEPVKPVAVPATTDLATVVVSARRRDERWIDVPLAVSVQDASELEALRLDSVAKALSQTPGAAVIDAGGFANQLQIRGVSSPLGGNENGYYFDDAPFTGVMVPIYPHTQTYDIARVEVLKGPQGTMFGEGSMGGTVRIFSRAPELDRTRAHVLVGASTVHDGGTGHRYSAMANLPLKEDELALRAVVSRERSAGWVDAPDGREDINVHDAVTQRLRLRWSPDDRWMTDLSITDTNVDAPGGSNAADDLLESWWRFSIKARWRGASLTSQYTLPASRVTFLRSRTRMALLQRTAPTAVPEIGTRISIAVDNTEVRWASTGGSPLDWLVGLSRREARRTDHLDVEGDLSEETSVNRADAAFGEATWRPPRTPWSLTAGLRYFREEVTARSLVADHAGEPPDDVHVVQDRWMPRFSAGWQVSDAALAYASVSTGVRSGQAQPASAILRAEAAGLEVPRRIRPDRLTSYEIGYKQLLQDGRLRMQGAVFRSRWHDMPVLIPTDLIANVLDNADGARIRGVELDVRYLPSERLDLGLAASFIDARYSADVPGSPIRRGTMVYNVPRVSLAGSARYAWRVNDHEASIAAVLRHQSPRQGLLGDDYRGDAITTLDLRFGWEGARWGWLLYGNNLTNERDAVDGRILFGQATRITPRTIGVDVQYRY